MSRCPTLLRSWPKVVLWGLTGLILLFLVLPIVAIVPLSLSAGTILAYPVREYSLRWYAEFFTDPVWVEATRISLLLGGVVTLLSTVLGVMAALGLHRSRSRLAVLARGILLLPLVMPVVILAVAMFYLYAALGLVGSFWGLVLAHTVLALPFVVVTVNAGLATLDPRLAAAGASLGASPWRIFFAIEFPLLRPSILAGAVLAFVTSFDELVVTLFVGGPGYRTLPRQIWSGVRESISPTVTAAAVVLICATVAAMAVMEGFNAAARRRLSARPVPQDPETSHA